MQHPALPLHPIPTHARTHHTHPLFVEIVETLAAVTEVGYTVLCAQFGSTAAWHTTAKLKTLEDLRRFGADGWRAANVWIVRDFVGDEALPEVAIG